MCAISTYCSTHQYGAEDHGFANARRVSIDHIRHFQAYSRTGNARIEFYYQKATEAPIFDNYEVNLMYKDDQSITPMYDLLK